MNYIYEVLVPFWRSDVVVGNAACPVLSHSVLDGVATVSYTHTK